MVLSALPALRGSQIAVRNGVIPSTSEESRLPASGLRRDPSCLGMTPVAYTAVPKEFENQDRSISCGTVSTAVALHKMNEGVPRSDRAPPRPPACTSGILTFPLLNLSRWRARRHRQRPPILRQSVCYHRPTGPGSAVRVCRTWDRARRERARRRTRRTGGAAGRAGAGRGRNRAAGGAHTPHRTNGARSPSSFSVSSDSSYWGREALPPFFLGLIVAYMLLPLVRRVEQRFRMADLQRFVAPSPR